MLAASFSCLHNFTKWPAYPFGIDFFYYISLSLSCCAYSSSHSNSLSPLNSPYKRFMFKSYGFSKFKTIPRILNTSLWRMLLSGNCLTSESRTGKKFYLPAAQSLIHAFLNKNPIISVSFTRPMPSRLLDSSTLRFNF